MIDKSKAKEQDGFDAIEYPLDFSFKAVCEKGIDISIDDLQSSIREAVESVVGTAATKGVSFKESSAGKYVSITAVAQLKNRQQLERVYTAISQLDIVKMTL